MEIKKFLLATDAELWYRFTSKIPRKTSINKQINELIEVYADDTKRTC